MLTFGTGAMGVYIADVAGKGVPAALLMSNLQAAVRAFAQEGAAPGSVATSVNRLLCRNMASGRFVTFCYARIDVAAGKLTYANSGHNPPLLIRADGTIEKLSPGGTVLGVFAESTYEQGDYALRPGDRLIFYTDGISEGRNAAGEEFGDEGVAALASHYRARGAHDMLAVMLKDIEAFNLGVYEDDATLIVAAL
jgi:sigma-B regulation protein RsbU (phosphoserine phosphatase)